MVRTLFNRANCDQEFRKYEFNHIQEVLLQNRNPENTSVMQNKNFNLANVNNINNGTPALTDAVASYIKNVSERVARIPKQFNIHLSLGFHVR